MPDAKASPAALHALSESLGVELQRQLGSGGVGAVYLVRDPALDRLCALKVLRDEFARDPQFQQRFEYEGRIAARLNHPNLVTIYRQGQSRLPSEDRVEDLRWMLMEYVPGQDMATLVARDAPMAPGRVVSLLSQAASALDVLHRAGIVHRDLKPANLLISGDRRDERLKVTDFGIAYAVDSSQVFTATSDGPSGTPLYMAPERLRGEPGMPQTDIYALACIVFECLTGVAPFRRETVEQVFAAHLNQPPPSVSASGEMLPPDLDAVFARALAKNPLERFASAGELMTAVRHSFSYMQTTGRVAVPPPPPPQRTDPEGRAPSRSARRGPWLAAAALVAAAVLGAGAFALHGGGGGHGTPTPTPTTSSDGTSPTAGPTTSPPPNPNPTPTGPSIRRQGSLVFANATEDTDLDADPSDPQWGRGSPSYDAELSYYNNGILYGTPYGDSALLGHTPADYNSCAQAPNYEQNTTIDLTSQSVGSYLCWKTGDGRFAAMQITQKSPSQLTLAITVYEADATS